MKSYSLSWILKIDRIISIPLEHYGTWRSHELTLPYPEFHLLILIYPINAKKSIQTERNRFLSENDGSYHEEIFSLINARAYFASKSSSFYIAIGGGRLNGIRSE